MEKELEQLREAWGIEKLTSPFVSSLELRKFYKMHEKIKDLETKIKDKNYE